MNNNKHLFIVILVVAVLSVFHFLRKESHFSLSETNVISGLEKAPVKPPGDLSGAESAQEKGQNQEAIDGFALALKDLYRDLPRRTALGQQIQAETQHGTSTVILEAATRLGAIKQVLSERASLKPQVLLFYRLCAKNPEIMTSLRAVCWQNALELYHELGRDPHEEEISADVRKLATQL